jgi:nucleotide-binding universal stress UspA family protein
MLVPKVEIQKILYATDLSENARHAFGYAVSLANMYEAQLVILYVESDDPNVEERLMKHVDPKQWDIIKKQNMEDAREVLIGKKKQSETIRQVLNHFCNITAEASGGPLTVRDEIEILAGNPAQEIISLAKEKNCDLIVLGSQGQTTSFDKNIGTTAEEVLRKVRIPVMVIHGSGENKN